MADLSGFLIRGRGPGLALRASRFRRMSEGKSPESGQSSQSGQRSKLAGEMPTPTRSSLLARLKAKEDQGSWEEFFEIYSDLIYNVARRARLSDADAKDIVQETTLKVYQGIGRFEKRRDRGSFKAWLCTVTRSRISNFYKKLNREPLRQEPRHSEDDPLEQVPDPKGPEIETVWEEEWQNTLVEGALARLKERVSPLQIQIFHAYVIREWDVAEVMRALEVSRAQVYLAKHRVGVIFREELAELQEEL